MYTVRWEQWISSTVGSIRPDADFPKADIFFTFFNVVGRFAEVNGGANTKNKAAEQQSRNEDFNRIIL